MQLKVRQQFRTLQTLDEEDGQVPWYVVDAAQSIDDVQREINTIVVERTLPHVQDNHKPLGLLWKTTTTANRGGGGAADVGSKQLQKQQQLESDKDDKTDQVSPQSTMDDVQDE